MGNFIELSPGYIVNIDSIFSLQDHEVKDERSASEWQRNYDELRAWYLKELPEIEYEGETLTASDNKEALEKYAKGVHSQIISQIGNPEDSITHEYIIILLTGVKLLITKEKFELINNYIKSNRILKDKLNNILK